MAEARWQRPAWQHDGGSVTETATMTATTMRMETKVTSVVAAAEARRQHGGGGQWWWRN
jgi:hypothetical protein